MMTDAAFLGWLKDRLVHVYGESPNMDFVQRLGRIVDAMTERQPPEGPAPYHEIYAQHECRPLVWSYWLPSVYGDDCPRCTHKVGNR